MLGNCLFISFPCKSPAWCRMPGVLSTRADSGSQAGPRPRISIRAAPPRPPPQQLPLLPEAGRPLGEEDAQLWPTGSLWSPQNITNELLQIEPEKAHSTAECEAFVQALPGSGSAPLLRTRVEDTNRRYERLVQLLDLAQEKWVSGGQQGGWLGSGGQAGTPSLLTCVLRVAVANRLEKSLQQGWEVLATYENQLTQDDTVPESGRALDSKRQELAVSVGTLGRGSLSVQALAPISSGQMRGPRL